MFHRSMSLGRVYKSTLSSARSQNLIMATADVILFPQIMVIFFKFCKYVYWYFSERVSLGLLLTTKHKDFNGVEWLEWNRFSYKEDIYNCAQYIKECPKLHEDIFEVRCCMIYIWQCVRLTTPLYIYIGMG